MYVQLQKSGHFSFSEKPSEGGTPASLDKDVMLVYTGTFKSMDGEVVINDTHLKLIETIHNESLKQAKNQNDLSCCPPLQLDHQTTATHTVGRLIGPVEMRETEIDGETKLALFGKARILGQENVEKVLDGRWIHVSIGADIDSGDLTELTITPFPAAKKAKMLSKEKNMAKKRLSIEEQEKKLAEAKQEEKLRKHLMEKDEKLSEEEADKKLSEMKDDEKKSLSEEVEKKEKLAAEEEEKKKLAQEEEEKKKLSDPAWGGKETPAEEAAEKKQLAAKVQITKLAAGFKETSGKIQLAALQAKVSGRLARLKSEAKITPAEIKKIDISKLILKGKDAIEVYLSAFENREPVIQVGMLGSTKAKTMTQLSKDVKAEAVRMSELQSRYNMPSKRKLMSKEEINIVKMSLGEKVDSVSGEVPDTKMGGEEDAKLMGMSHDEHHEHMKKLMAEGKHEEMLKHLSKYVNACKMCKMSDEEHTLGAPEKEISSLAEEAEKLHTQYEQIIKLVTENF